MDSLTVPRQHPLERIIRQPLHRVGLLRPGIPAVVFRSRQPLRVPVPIQMISGEKEPVVEKQNAMAFRMAFRQDCQKPICQRPRSFSVEHYLCRWLRRKLVAMNDPPASKMLGELMSVGYVVPVREKNVLDAAKRFQPLHEGADEFGRIDKPVAVGMADKI